MNQFNKNYFLISILLFIITSSIGQQNDWKFVGPGGNGWWAFYTMHPASGDLYLASDMQLSLFRSTDNAQTWLPIANKIPGTGYYIAGDPKNENILYMNQMSVSNKQSGIWKSTNKGDSWKLLINTDLFGKSRGQSGLVDPENNKILYWTDKYNGVQISKDGGFSWKNCSKGLPLNKIKQKRGFNALELDNIGNAKTRKIYYPTSVGLYIKNGLNKYWKLSKGLPKSNCTQVVVCNDGVVYASFPKKGLYKSINRGKNWIQIQKTIDGKFPLRVVTSKKNSKTVYIATVNDNGVYRSDNGGDSFELITHIKHNAKNNWPLNYRQHEAVSGFAMLVNPSDSDIVYLDYNKMTDDGGKTWQHYGTKEITKDRYTNTGLAILTEYKTAFDLNRPGKVWLGFSDTGLMRSEDNGNTIVNAPSYHRGEVNQVAGFRDRLVNTSGSCTAIAIDPTLSTTIYGTLSMKNSTNRANVGGVIIKSVDDGWNWQAIHQPQGLADGIVRSIVIDPNSPVHNRTLFAASYGNGVYKSEDDGKTFRNVTPSNLFKGNTRLMDLQMAPSNSKVLYLGVGGSYGIRPIYFGPNAYPKLKPGMYGGIYKSIDSGANWIKCNSTREIPSVQGITVNPFNDKELYVAAWSEQFLLDAKANKSWKKGGVYKTVDGGENWELILESPFNDINGLGEVNAVVINPVAPEIVYAAVQNYGVYRTLNAGKTWSLVGEESMSKMQRRYHSINVNPHNPAEVWVAHFGSSFSKIIDSEAKAYLDKKFKKGNYVQNGNFESVEKSGFVKNWKLDQPPVPKGEKQVISVKSERENNTIKFYLTQAYTDAPSPYQADNEQRRLEKEGLIEIDEKWSEEYEVTGETRSWIYQKIDPYFTSLARGKKVKIEMDVFVEDRNLQKWWMRGSESGEIPMAPPHLTLTEARDYNVHWIVAEASIEDLHLLNKDIKGKWLHLTSTGYVSDEAQSLRITVMGVGMYSGPTKIYVDNVSLTIK